MTPGFKKTENLIHLLKRREPTTWHETSLRFSDLCIMLRKVMWSGSSVLSCAAQKARLLTAPEEKASSVIPRQVFQDTGWKVWPKLSTGLQTQQLRIHNLLLQAAGLNLSLASRSPPPEPSRVWQRLVFRDCWPSTWRDRSPYFSKAAW